MDIKEAIKLIEGALPAKVDHAQWADLGCGSGTFTMALSYLLGEGSVIYAVDKQSQVIQSPTDVAIKFIKADFSIGTLPASNLHGILMANALHYIQDKSRFVEKLKNSLQTGGQLILVEYDTDSANQWVPYPLSFNKMKNLFSASGFSSIEKVGEYNSIYNANKMYACVITR
jgi:ubiquinone/menaquinone biosynthesis C-methylase UbiE